MFGEGVYQAPEGEMHQISDLVRALPICIEADQVTSALRREKRQPTAAEADLIAKAEALRDILIQVDVFDHLTDAEGNPDYVRPALQGTEERLAGLDQTTFSSSSTA